MKGLSVVALIILAASGWNVLAKSPPIDKSSDASPWDLSSEDDRHSHDRNNHDHDREDHDRDDHEHHRHPRSGLHFMFTLGTSGIAGYTLSSTAATPLPGSPFALDLSVIRTVGDTSVVTMALADSYLYVLASEPGSIGDRYLSYHVSSAGLTLAGSGAAPPQAFDRSTVAMIPNAGNIYFVSARDSTTSTIETGESYLDIAQASGGSLSASPIGASYPLDDCGAQSANFDVATSSLLVSCAPGTATPTAVIIPIASPTTPVAVTIPTPASGTVGESVLADGYLYVVVHAMLLLDINGTMVPTEAFQSFSVSSTGEPTFIAQYSIDLPACCTVFSLAASGGNLFYAYDAFENGSVASLKIAAGNMTAGFLDAVPSTPTGSLFFDAPASMLLSNFQFRTYGAFVIPLASPIDAYSVSNELASAASGLAVVGN